MPTYRYIAKDPEGKTVTAKMSADNEEMIIAELRKRNLTIISIDEEKVSSTTSKAKPQKNKKIKSDDIVILTRQFSTMVDAGIPILQALDALAQQTTNPSLKRIIEEIQEDIQLGKTLSGAFSKHVKVFDEFYINMLKVGETGGILNIVLERTAMYLEKTEKLKQKIKSAMIYPAVVISLAMMITIGLLIFVVPTFEGIYDSLGQKLPLMTQILINTSNFLQHQMPLLVGIIIVSIFGFIKYRKTDQGRLVTDSIALKLPIFGSLFCKVSVSRFSRTFSTLTQSGVAILETLDIVAKTCGNRVIELLVNDIKESVREGGSISEPLSKSEYFPPMVTRMIATGEKSGQLEKMLSKVAEFYDDQVDAAVEGLTKLIEPLIIAFLGIVVGFIVVALFMPILNLTSAIH